MPPMLVNFVNYKIVINNFAIFIYTNYSRILLINFTAVMKINLELMAYFRELISRTIKNIRYIHILYLLFIYFDCYKTAIWYCSYRYRFTFLIVWVNINFHYPQYVILTETSLEMRIFDKNISGVLEYLRLTK